MEIQPNFWKRRYTPSIELPRHEKRHAGDIGADFFMMKKATAKQAKPCAVIYARPVDGRFPAQNSEFLGLGPGLEQRSHQDAIPNFHA